MEEEYINFGDELVSKLDLLKAIGDYKAYSSTQPWSAARRGAFDSVIELALNRGILGTRKYTNPDTGESMYYATFGGDPFDINTYDKNTRRGWQDAAGFIGKLAESLPTKKSIEEKKKKEEEERIAKLPTFDSNSFLSTLYKNISDKEFGGQAFDGKTFDMNRWNTLDDVRDEKGAVGTNKRKKALAKYLEDIDRDFNAGEYNWENSPFKDADDFKSRLGEAVRALRSEDLNDDTPALNKLGINYKDWFNNRTGEVYTTDEQGNPITYGTYYRGLQALKDAKILAANAKAEAARKAYNANLIGGLKWFGGGLQGKPLSPEHSNMNYLNGLAAKDILSGDEMSELVGVFKLAGKNGALLNLSKEELARLGTRFGSNPNRFKKIQNLNGLYWDTLTNKIAKPYGKEQQGLVNFEELLKQNSPEGLAKKEEEKILLAANRKLDDGWEAEDYLRMGAMALDIVGGLAAWAPGYGTATSGILGLTSLGTNMAADIADESLTKWDVAKNAGVNLGLAAVGMVPGLGLASKTGKWITNIAKWAPRLLTLLAIKDLPESYNSLLKAINNPKELTNTDWRNIAYGLSIAAGLSRGTAGIKNNRMYKPAFTESTEKQYTITTSKGKKTIKLELVDNIKKLNPKDKEKYNLELKKILGLAEDETVDTKNVSIFGKTLKEKGVNIEEENVPSGLSSKAKAYREYLENRNEYMKNGQGWYKFAPRFLPTNYDIYKGAATLQIPSFGLSDRLRSLWNPLSDRNLQRKGIKVGETNTTELPVNMSKIKGYLENLKSNKKESTSSNSTNSTSKLSNSTSELIVNTPKSENNLRGLPAPGQTNRRGEIVNIGKRPSKEFSTRQNQQELNDFIDSYGLNSKRGNRPIKGGYDPTKEYLDGNRGVSIAGGPVINMEKTGNKITVTFGNIKKEFKNLALARQYLAKKLYLSDLRKNDIALTAEILRSLKLRGVFKQGGTIDKQRIQRYKEFIKK